MKLIYKESELKEKPKDISDAAYASLVKDLSLDWGCVLCGIKEIYTSTSGEKITGLQILCCPTCGQSTLRPSREVEETNERRFPEVEG